MMNKQQYVERKKYKKEQIYDAIAKRIREICDLTDSVTSAECLKNMVLCQDLVQVKMSFSSS